MKGTVRWFDARKGYGFIYAEELGGDLFVHISKVLPNPQGYKTLWQDERVEFQTYKDESGLKATNVKEDNCNGNERI